jgi:hypothetical protein
MINMLLQPQPGQGPRGPLGWKKPPLPNKGPPDPILIASPP